jgi:hypothetical protein
VPPRIVYITGSGRSGSTILDMMLGAHSRALSLGQVDELDRWDAEGYPCTCRRSLAECPVWGPFLQDREPPASLNQPGRVRKVTATLQALGGNAAKTVGPDDLDGAWDLYDRVAELQGADVLIDSTKSVLRFARLAAEPRGHDVRMIHLVRDPRGFVLSRMKSKPVPTTWGEVGTTTSQSFASAIGDWGVVNALAALYEWRRRPNHVVVSYEELVSKPAATLERLSAFAGLEFEPDRQLPPLEGEFHLVGGNASRLQFRELRLDEKWRTDLPHWQRLGTLLSVGWLHAWLRRQAAEARRAANPAA